MCPRSKSPGEDGLTAEFYVVAWDVVGLDFLDVCNAMLRRRCVAPSHIKGVMTLLPKKAKPSSMKDLRPVTLLDVDGKIFSRVLARRLEVLAPRMLHPMQVQRGSDRTMHGALVDIRDAISIVGTANSQKGVSTGACLVSIDIAGAFNNVLHGYLFEVLRRYGVSQDAVRIIESMYRGATTTIRINGAVTPPVALQRGIRQGCPYSMLLFNIAVSPLVKALDKQLTGIRLPNVIGGIEEPRLAVSAYVDDAVVVLDSEKDVAALTSTLASFGEESGLHINTTKTKALPLGSWRTSIALPFPYVESVKEGVTFTKSIRGMFAANWPDRVGALRAVLLDARLRALNIVQRVQYANTYALSILWHLAQVVPVQAGAVKDVRKALNRFLWAGELFSVPFDVMVQPRSLGGLSLQDPLRRSRAFFASRWLTAARSPTTTLAGGWLRVLAVLHNDTPVPSAAKHFEAVRSALGVAPGGVLGKSLTRALYRESLAADRVAPRVEVRRGDVPWPLVWSRVHSKVLLQDVRASWYRHVQDVVATKDRAFAIGRVDSPLCADCGHRDTALHRLVACGPTRTMIWRWTARKVAQLTGVPVNTVSPELLIVPDFEAPSDDAAVATTWLLGNVVEYVARSAHPDVDAMRAVLTARVEEVAERCPAATTAALRTI